MKKRVKRIKTAAELPRSDKIPPFLDRNGAAPGSGVCGIPPAEFAEFAETALARLGETPAANSPTSANSAGGIPQKAVPQKAVYPEDSILADWMKFGRDNTESADAYIIGSILPVCGAILGRRAWIEFGDMKKYANVFAMLAGKPGDRKSSIINLAEMLARRVLNESAFMPESFSPETLFDEFSEDCGGQPDKLWIADDANSVLTDFRTSQNGERVSSRVLKLYDCRPMSDNFRRNKDSKEGRRREILETSTSLLFGATFNIACFQGQSVSVRGGLTRRFLYYVAEDHARLITWPPRKDLTGMEALNIWFEELKKVSGNMILSRRAMKRWEEYQRANRDERNRTDPLQDAKLSRLSTAPMQVLGIAMIFEACRWAKAPTLEGLEGERPPWRGVIEERTLNLAIEHVDENLKAVEFLDSIANKAEIAQEAEILLAKVRYDFHLQFHPDHPDFIIVNRSDLTRRYCHDSGRRNSLKPEDLYHRLIPHLERCCRDACFVEKKGKQEWFAFRAE